jgi:hypothetical protein
MATKLLEITEYQKYYLDGFYEGKFAKTDIFATLKAKLQDICDEKLDAGFSLDQKYIGTKDLRPNAFEYSDTFINILVENNIHSLIENLVGKRLTLAHLQVRTSSAEQSYMPWHRDSYATGDEYVGPIPPAHKLIFYLNTGASRPKLELAVGSHICRFKNQNTFILPGCSNFDREVLNVLEKKSYYSSDDTFLIFNTGMLHSVIPDLPDEKSVRIIYSFIEKGQFNEIFAHKNSHLMLNNLYENTIASKEL